jgi:hypothetical protein
MNQLDMFAQTSEDLPLFSGTPITVKEQAATLQPVERQRPMFNLWDYTDIRAIRTKRPLIFTRPTA